MAGHDHTQVVHDHADSWHHHSAAEGRPQHEHTAIANPSVLFHWFLLIVVSGITVIVALMMFFGKTYNLARREKIETLYFYDNFAAPARDKAEGLLGVDKPLSQYTYHPADAQAHTVQLPIEEAMNRVVQKYKK